MSHAPVRTDQLKVEDWCCAVVPNMSMIKWSCWDVHSIFPSIPVEYHSTVLMIRRGNSDNLGMIIQISPVKHIL